MVSIVKKRVLDRDMDFSNILIVSVLILLIFLGGLKFINMLGVDDRIQFTSPDGKIRGLVVDLTMPEKGNVFDESEVVDVEISFAILHYFCRKG